MFAGRAVGARKNVGVAGFGMGEGKSGVAETSAESKPGKLQWSIASKFTTPPTPADRQNDGIHKVRLCFYAAGGCYGWLGDTWGAGGREERDGWLEGGPDDGARPWTYGILNTWRIPVSPQSPLSWIFWTSSGVNCWLTIAPDAIDCTQRAVSLATSAPSATPAPTPPSSRLRVSPRRRMRSSTSARYVVLMRQKNYRR